KTPDQVKAWREDKANPWDVPAADVTGAVCYVTVPFSAVSPRMRLLETQLAAAVGVKLAADPAALADRFAKAQPPAAVWAPSAAEEPFAYTRVLATFLPRSEGGYPPGELKLQERLQQAETPP